MADSTPRCPETPTSTRRKARKKKPERTTISLLDLNKSHELTRRSGASEKTKEKSKKNSPEKSRNNDRKIVVCSTSERHRPQQYAAEDNGWERVKVTVRVRPYTKLEKAREDEVPIIHADVEEKSVTLHRNYDKGGAGESTEFKFDAVLPSDATQADVYNTAAQAVVLDVLDGYNGTIMAYGQTGAGKTYTLSAMVVDEFGGQTAEGIIPRSAADIFARVDEDKDHEYHVSMSYIQIYMEMIQDLFRPENLNLQIREGEDGDIFVAGVQQIEIKSVEDVVRLLLLGDCNRCNAFTKMNAHSSRSHAIVIFTVEKKSLHMNKNLLNAKKRSVKGSGLSAKILVGKLFLVDLAGSERLKRSGSEGLRATEAMSVNMSLSALGKCISARADPSVSHIPFRESKLTRLLQESFGGNAKTSLIINIAPCSEYIHETLSSLQFGSRAMKVCTKAMVNAEEDFHTLSSNLKYPFEHTEENLFSLQGVESFEHDLFQRPRSVLELQNVELEKLTEEQDDPYVIYEKFLVLQRKRNEEWHHRLQVIKAAAKEHLYEQETRIEKASKNLQDVVLKPHAKCEQGALADDNFLLIMNSTSQTIDLEDHCTEGYDTGLTKLTIS